MTDNAQMRESAQEEQKPAATADVTMQAIAEEEKTNQLSIVAVVKFNAGEALVLNRPLRFVYEKVGNDFVGKDGPFSDFLYYSRGGGSFVAFAGRTLSLQMADGTVCDVKDHWWHGAPKGCVDAIIGDVDSLQRCYVFGSGSIQKEAYQALRDTYTGCVYPYWDYEKIITHQVRTRMWLHEIGRRSALVKKVKETHREAEMLRARVSELEADQQRVSDLVNNAWADGKNEGHGDATAEASVVIGGLRKRVAELEAERASREKQVPVGHFAQRLGRFVQLDADCWPKGHEHSIPLYADPPVAAPVRLTDSDVVDLFQAWNTTDGASHADLILSVETAVLRANGFKMGI